MKILQLGKFYPIKGGVEKVMFDLMLGLSIEGVECDMLCASCNEESFVREISDKAKLIVTHTVKEMAATMISPSMVLKLKQIADEYDIIHVHHPDPMAALAQRHPETESVAQTLHAVTKMAGEPGGCHCWHYAGVCQGVALLEEGTAQGDLSAYRGGTHGESRKEGEGLETEVSGQARRVLAGKTGAVQGI